MITQMNKFLFEAIFILTILFSPLESKELDNDDGIERIDNQGWDILTNEWPPAPSSSENNFYFQDNHIEQLINLRKIRLRINESMIDNKMINSTNCIISFKLWFFEKNVQPPVKIPMARNVELHDLYLTLPYGRIDLRTILSNYTKRWNPLRYRLDCGNISKFQIEYYSGFYFLAFKDFQIISSEKQPPTERILYPNSTYIITNLTQSPTNVCLSISHNVVFNTTIRISYLLQPIFSIHQKNINSLAKYRIPITILNLDSFKTTSHICLQEFINFSSRNYTILLESTIDKDELKVETQNVSRSTTPIYFLRSFDRLINRWPLDWFHSYDDYGTFDFNGDAIHFNLDCRFSNNDELMTWRISSRWIQFNDFNFNSTRIFEYSYDSDNNTHITAQICTQLGHCSDVSVRSIQLNLNSKIVHFKWSNVHKHSCFVWSL
nr:uncharacterized protein LOC124495878 [Dermatophagoides farinae]